MNTFCKSEILSMIAAIKIQHCEKIQHYLITNKGTALYFVNDVLVETSLEQAELNLNDDNVFIIDLLALDEIVLGDETNKDAFLKSIGLVSFINKVLTYISSH